MTSFAEKRADEDRPVICINRVTGIALDVYPCAADAEILADDLLEYMIIDVCNSEQDIDGTKYIWRWYDPAHHGSFTEITKNLILDLDDAAREFYEED